MHAEQQFYQVYRLLKLHYKMILEIILEVYSTKPTWKPHDHITGHIQHYIYILRQNKST